MSDNEDAPRLRRSKRKRSNLEEVNGGELEDLKEAKKPKTEKKVKAPKATKPSPAKSPKLAKSNSKASTDAAATTFTPSVGTKDATQALAALYKRIVQEPTFKKDGFSVDFVDDNMYKWQIKLFDFGVDTQIHEDLFMFSAETGKEGCVLMEAIFPRDFPYSPPFLRVVYPRFFQYTGHITIGGSICVKELTRSGWTPEIYLPQLIIMVRDLLVEGGALVDMESSQYEYTEDEAKEAFDRVARAHGWQP